MSYQQRILKDNPIGFWPLDSVSSNSSPDASSGMFVSGTRTNNNATVGSGVLLGEISPLVCGGTASASLSQGDSTAKITISNNYNIFYRGTERKEFCIEFWMSLEKLLNNDGAYKCSVLNIPNILELNILDDVMSLEVIDPVTSTKKYGYAAVPSFDPQLHILLSYSDKAFSVAVNGVNIANVKMENSYYFNNLYTSPPSIIFDCNLYGNTARILIDSIAFYCYRLRLEQIREHMVWALTDKDVYEWILSNDGGYVSPDNNNKYPENYYMFDSNDEWKTGSFSNCVVNDGVLGVRPIPQLKPYSTIGAAQVSLSSTNGLQTQNASSLLWENFGAYFVPGSDTLTMSIKPSGPGTFMSIDGFNFGQIGLRYTTSDSGTIELFSPETPTISLKQTGVSTGSFKDVLIYFEGQQIKMQVGTSTVISHDTGSQITFPKLSLYLGNSYVTDALGNTATSPINGGIKNFKINYLNNRGWVNIELLTNYFISQYSEWIAQVLPKTDSNIIGSRIFYGASSRNVEVYTSLDKVTWSKVNVNGQEVPGLTLGQSQPIVYLKIVINTPDSSSPITPQVDFLEVSTERSMYMDSRGFHFTITPRASNTKHAYVVRPSLYNVLSRDNNIGLYFQKPGALESAAVAEITPSFSYKVVEFWFKVHTSPESSDTENCIMQINSSGAPKLYYDNDLKLNLSGSDWSVAYLDGKTLSGTPTLVLDEIYHFIGILGSNATQPISLNGRYDGTKWGLTSIGSITLYPTNLFTTQALADTHYKKFLGINPYTVDDTSGAITITDTPKVIAAQWATVPSAIV
jgi:hypothetical protein